MTIYLLGSDGYLASEFYKKTKYKEECKRVSKESKEKDYYFDLLNKESFDFDIIEEKDIILFFAAISSPDYCEKNQEISEKINVKGTSYFINQFLKKNARVLFFSSDAVFNGGENIFYEDSQKNPISKYGEMKSFIEEEFKGKKDFKVFRLSYIFSKKDKFSLYLEDCIKKNIEVEVYPLSRNIVYLDDLILGIDNLISSWDYLENQIFNICGDNLISREDIANYFQRIISPTIKIKNIDPFNDFFKSRPKIINMRSNFFSNLLKKKPLTIEEAMLKEYEGFFNDYTETT